MKQGEVKDVLEGLTTILQRNSGNTLTADLITGIYVVFNQGLQQLVEKEEPDADSIGEVK